MAASKYTTEDLLNSLPPKQRHVMEAIVELIGEQGYPPSIQQLCKRCGVSSTSTIHYHVSALKKKGFIDWNALEKRSITLCAPFNQKTGASSPKVVPLAGIPILGTIAAGAPIEAVENEEDQIQVDPKLCPKGCYALRVRGLSMIEDHILDGDIVVINPKAPVRDGDVVVALVENQNATLKRIYREGKNIRLQPANQTMAPMFYPEVDVQGRLETIIRQFRH